jgi:hypothetical protein
MTLRFVECDGGRAAARFPDTADGDCVPRAVAIATGLGYQQAHDMLERIRVTAPDWFGHSLGDTSADHGVEYNIFLQAVQTELRWEFHECDQWDRLPAGRLIVQLISKPPHVCAVIDQTIYDLFDPRGGHATMYGYWTSKTS